jgi:hypothetical protein
MKRAIRILGFFLLVIFVVLVVLAFLGPILSRTPQGGCVTVGCPSSLKVLLTGSAPQEYELTVKAGNRQVYLRCARGVMMPGSLSRVNAGEGIFLHGFDVDETSCMEEGVHIDEFVPAFFTVTVVWEGGSRRGIYYPKYEWCGGCCICGTVHLGFPN